MHLRQSALKVEPTHQKGIGPTRPSDWESCGGKCCVPNLAATWLEGRSRACVPTAIGSGSKGNTPKRHRAHDVPPTGNPAKVRAPCLTLRLLGSEAEPVRLRQSTLEEEPRRQKCVGPTKPCNWESCRGKGYMPNPSASWPGGRVRAWKQRSYARKASCQRGAPNRESCEGKAACLTLQQPGSEAKFVRLRQPALEPEAMHRMVVGPLRYKDP